MNKYTPNSSQVKGKEKSQENEGDNPKLVDLAASIDPWYGLKKTMEKHFFAPDLVAVRAVCAAVAAHRLKGAPVWIILKGPPSSGKSFLEAFRALPHTHLIDQVTKATFLSGQMREVGQMKTSSASLLHRIGKDGLIIIPDFSTILGMRRDHRRSAVSDMRRIYDGSLRKEYGTGDRLDEREWEGRITFLVGATPSIEQHYSALGPLGERLVTVCWDRPGGDQKGVQAALVAMNQDSDAAKAEVQDAVQHLFDGLPELEPTLPAQLQERIAALAEFTCRARTHVPRDSYRKSIITVPEPEGSPRLAKQLAQLAKGSALLEGREQVNEEDLKLVQRVAFDCLPQNRLKILDHLIESCDSPGMMMLPPDLPSTTLHYAEEELEALHVLNGASLSALSIRLLCDAGVLQED